MDIKYLGHSSFLIKGKSGVIVTDPFSKKSTGFAFPSKIEADIVTVSHDHDDHNAVSEVSGAPFVVKGAGEYEIKGISIIGLSAFHDQDQGVSRGRNTIYRIEIDGIRLLHLGDLGHALKDELLEEIGTVDILFVPVGGKYTLGPAEAKAVISDIDANIVIPMHYKTAGHDEHIFGELSALEAFLKESGKEGLVAQPKLSVIKDKIPQEQTFVVLS